MVLQPFMFETEYEITEVPGETPVTTPEALISAIFVEPLDQIPPPVTSAN